MIEVEPLGLWSPRNGGLTEGTCYEYVYPLQWDGDLEDPENVIYYAPEDNFEYAGRYEEYDEYNRRYIFVNVHGGYTYVDWSEADAQDPDEPPPCFREVDCLEYVNNNNNNLGGGRRRRIKPKTRRNRKRTRRNRKNTRR